MRRRWLLLIGLGVYVIALVIAAPATLIDAVLRNTGDSRLRLADARGTVWSGSGQLELRDAGGHNGVAKSVAWRVLPSSLWRGHLVCEVELDHAPKRFAVAISLSQVEVADADFELPAAVLGLAIPK